MLILFFYIDNLFFKWKGKLRSNKKDEKYTAHLSQIGETKNGYTILVGKCLKKQPLG
jgi:hypothetical protein